MFSIKKYVHPWIRKIRRHRKETEKLPKSICSWLIFFNWFWQCIHFPFPLAFQFFALISLHVCILLRWILSHFPAFLSAFSFAKSEGDKGHSQGPAKQINLRLWLKCGQSLTLERGLCEDFRYMYVPRVLKSPQPPEGDRTKGPYDRTRNCERQNGI